MTLKVLDLFSGIGGMSLGLERAGMETVAFCEIDPFCQQILKKHWPDVPIYDDVRTLDYDGSVNLICGGYPCQGESVAGKLEGENDDRWLWPAMFSLIQKHRPTWVIGENVANHANLSFPTVFVNLESEGYEVQPFIIPACAVDAPHKRERIWVLAHRHDTRQPTSEGPRQSERTRAGHDIGRGGSDVADTRRPRWQKQYLTTKPNNQGYSSRRDVEERGAWPTEPAVCRMAHGVPNRSHRIRALGNAVVPQIPEIIGRAIMEISK